MKKFIITLFLITVLNTLLEFIFPWWILALVSGGVCMVARLNLKESFLVGFLGILISWLVMILFKDIPNHHLLSYKMANLFPMGGHYGLFILFNLLIGGLIGGLSGLCGRMMRQG